MAKWVGAMEVLLAWGVLGEEGTSLGVFLFAGSQHGTKFSLKCTNRYMERGGFGGGRGGGRGGQSFSREGNWMCPNCNASVFPNKQFCFRCQTPKPGAPPGPPHGANSPLVIEHVPTFLPLFLWQAAVTVDLLLVGDNLPIFHRKVCFKIQ